MIRLEGYDKEWQLVNQERTVKYTNLNPATYTFQVKAANSDGIWNEKVAALKIIIYAPLLANLVGKNSIPLSGLWKFISSSPFRTPQTRKEISRTTKNQYGDF